LLLLGYQVYDWEFRVLFKGLIQAFDDARIKLAPKSISMQIDPKTNRKRAKIKAYLEEFFGQSHFEVYWGDAPACMHALWQLWTKGIGNDGSNQ
jgi:hypothetical protein